MDKLIDFFSNRELSVLIWFAVFLMIFITSKSVRKGLNPLFNAFFFSVLFDIFIMMFIYIELVILCLAFLDFWDLSFLKESISWTLFVGFPLIMSFQKVNSEEKYLKSIILNSLKGIVIVEFIANFYSFSLIIELIIIPIILFIIVFQISIENKKELKLVSNFLKNIMAVFGLIILGHLIYKISQGLFGFLNISTLQSFLLPIIMTIALLPFLYFVALYSLYETMIIRMSIRLKKKKHKYFLKMKLLQKFHINRPKLRKFQQKLGFEPIMNKSDIKRIIKKFKS